MPADRMSDEVARFTYPSKPSVQTGSITGKGRCISSSTKTGRRFC